MQLAEIVPWGRSYDEYRRMFALSDADLAGRILGCGDGPAAFNAEATRQRSAVVSTDPLYVFSEAAILRRIDETADAVMRGVAEHRDRYCWTEMGSPANLLRTRRSAMDTFLRDYDEGRRGGRYVPAALPHLPFGSGSFDLVLCSHLLFTYSDHLSADVHVAAADAMLRVAGEARIFPLLTLDGRPAPHVGPVCEAMAANGVIARVEEVPYRFQWGGNTMLRLQRGTGGPAPS